MALSTAELLFYSDDPEELSEARQGLIEGVLFDFDVRPGPTVRFLYYHVNADAVPRFLCLRVVNIGQRAATLRWLASVGPPSTAYMHVGHASTMGFLEALAGEQWTETTIAVGENVILRSDATSGGTLVTGLAEMTLVSGDDVRVSLVAATDPARAVRVAETGATFRPDGFGRAGMFDLRQVAPVQLTFSVGGARAGYRLGDRQPPLPNCRMGMTRALAGDYGVISSIDVTIDNPTSTPAAIALYESARGGAATGSYLIDGRVVASQTMPTAMRHKLWVFSVPGHAKVTSRLYALPDSGSNLPVEISLDADDGSPAPNAPGSLVAYGTGYSIS